jgi:hypothetical protein
VTLNGTLSYSSIWTNPYGAYSNHVSGSVTALYNSILTTIGNLNFTDTGVEDTYGDTQYTVNPFTFSIDFTIGGGFATTLLAQIKGDDTI